jgi:hypothetical protein
MAINDKTFKKLKDIAGESNFSRAKEDLVCYAYDATAQTYLPDAVLFPQNALEISAILKLANKDSFFVIPRGAGSGMTGGSLAVRGGIILSRVLLQAVFMKLLKRKIFFIPRIPQALNFVLWAATWQNVQEAHVQLNMGLPVITCLG